MGFEDEYGVDPLQAVTVLAVVSLALTRIAYVNNRLDYDSVITRTMAGFLKMYVNLWHAEPEDLKINARIVAFGVHNSAIEVIAAATQIKGEPTGEYVRRLPFMSPQPVYKAPPLHAVVTNRFDKPGLKQFLDRFEVIRVDFSADKKTPRAPGELPPSVQKAGEVLDEKPDSCVLVCPQGDFAYEDLNDKDNEVPRIFNGTALLALHKNEAIQVVRGDGLWSLQNPWIPHFIKNTLLYHAFGTVMHPNNIRTIAPWVIDFHLKPENAHLSREEKIFEINAQLYAFFRHRELTPEEVKNIHREIESGTHRLIWQNRLDREAIKKELKGLNADNAKLAKESKQEGAYHYLLDGAFFGNKQKERELKQKLAELREEKKTLEATSLDERTHGYRTICAAPGE